MPASTSSAPSVFVHFSGAGEGSDEQTRRVVRSQAMRDYRRRQREAGAARLSDDCRQPREPQSRARRTSASARHVANRNNIRFLPCEYQPAPRSRSSSPQHSPQSSDDRISRASRSSFASSASSAQLSFGAADCITPGAHDCSASQSSSPSHPTLDDGVSDDGLPLFMPDVCCSGIESFDSPAQVARMTKFLERYLLWLRPGMQPSVASRVFSRAWRDSPSAVLLAASCLASVGHLDAMRPEHSHGNYDVYKWRVLTEVTKRMRSPQTATSYDTINTLCCLLAYEMFRDSGEALTHLNGLKAIVSLKGGLGSPDLDGTRTMLETLDVVNAVLSTQDLVISGSLDLRALASEQGWNKARTIVFHRLIPLLQNEQEDYFKSPTDLNVPDLSYALVVMAEGAKCADITLSSQDDTPMSFLGSEEYHTIPLAQFRSSLEFLKKVLVNDRAKRADAFHIRRAIYLVMSIFYSLLVNKIPHRHSSHQVYVDQLYHSVRRITDDTWQYFPYLRILVLLAGGAACMHPIHNSFFKGQLVRAIFQLGDNQWWRVKAYILRFLAVRQIIDNYNVCSSNDDCGQILDLEFLDLHDSPQDWAA